MKEIFKIIHTKAVQWDNHFFNFFKRKKEKKKKALRNTKKSLAELTKIMEETHKELVQKDSPFRMCIYQEGDDIFIDIVTIDDSGRPAQTFKHDISHDELEDLVAHIKTGRGLILDADV